MSNEPSVASGSQDEPGGPSAAAAAVATKHPAMGTCRFCKLKVETDAKICPNCQQWQRPKGRGAEQWLSLFGALIGLASTLILIGTYARDQISEPKPKLLALRASCEKTGIIVEITNDGRAHGFVPRFATEKMSRSPEQGLNLFLAESIKVAPGDTVEAVYQPRDSEKIQVNSDHQCKRDVQARGLKAVQCDNCMLL